MRAKLLKSCPILCNLLHCSPPDFSVHGILQARILEWVAISFSREIYQTRGLNLGLLCGRQILSSLSHQGSSHGLTHTKGYCSAVKRNVTNAGHAKDVDSIPTSGRFPWRRKWQPTPVFFPGKSHGQRSLEGYNPQGRKSQI